MNILKVTRHTTNEQIERFLKDNPHCCTKTIRAQALFERRIKRSEHKREQEKNDRFMNRVRPQYQHSIFDRSME